MRVGIVFHKNPYGACTGIDLVRLRAIAGGLVRRGIEAEIIAPVPHEGAVDGFIPVRGLSALRIVGRYDVIKTSYHHSIMLLDDYAGPVVSRIVRVVDDRLPERDEPFRDTLLRCQERIKARAAALVLNNKENRARWRLLYGNTPRIALIPTGCPATLPPLKGNPLASGPPAILFLGSLSAPRMVHILNEAARRLAGRAQVHLIGKNKACMYGGDSDCDLDPLVADHGELDEDHVWPYITNARIGLAVATGPYAFDNDVSKIFNYLRGGLPALSEEPIVNNDLIRQTGLGHIFRYGDVDDLVARAKQLLEHPPETRRETVMRFMASEHSWDKRVDSYIELFESVLDSN
jgi:glycosyltransferase involved in cell wall biosynthesis